MFTTRAALRSTRAIRTNNAVIRRQVRHATNDANASRGSNGLSLSNPNVTAALAGAGAAVVTVYIYGEVTGINKAARTAKEAKKYVDTAKAKAKETFKEATPDPNQALEALRNMANQYAGWIPGGREYVDKAFKDLDTIRSKHGSEFDKIVREAYSELRDIANRKGVSMQALGDSWAVLQKHLQRLSGLAANAGQELLNNHPDLKQKFGGSFEQLQRLGDELGPEAKRVVDETWNEVSQIFNQGFNWSTVEKVKELVEQKTKEVQKLGEQAWQKGYEQLKPLMDRNPQVKKLVEQNMDMLKQGRLNVGELVSQVQQAVSSGNTQNLEQYLQKAKESFGQSSSTNLSSWLSMAPDGSKIMSQLQKLKQVADKQGYQAEKLVSETLKDIAQVLEKRSQQLEQLADSASKGK